MPVPQIVQECRRLGAGGIWMPPGPTMALDVSGYGRHAVYRSGAVVPWQGPPSITHPPMTKGPGGIADPYVATIPAIGEANTILVYAHVPTTSERGALVMLSNLGARGLGLGVGSTDMDTVGNNLLALNEGIAWHVGSPVGTGFRLLVMSSVNGASLQKLWADGVLNATHTRAALSAGTVTEVHLGGYPGGGTAPRVTSCAWGVAAWWDRALSDAEVIALSTAGLRSRAR